MVNRRKNYRPRRRTKRRMVKRMKKRVISKRRFKIKRRTRRIKRRLPAVRPNGGLTSKKNNYMKYTITVDCGNIGGSQTAERHAEFMNISTGLLAEKVPDILDYRFIRIKRATLRFQLKQFDSKAWFFEHKKVGSYYSSMLDAQDGVNKSYFKIEADTDADGDVKRVNFGTYSNALSPEAYGLNNFTKHALFPKVHSVFGGSRTFRPYIQTNRQMLWHDYTADVEGNEENFNIFYKKDYNSWLPINTGDLRPMQWVQDVRLILPQVSKLSYKTQYYTEANAKNGYEVTYENKPQPYWEHQFSYEVEVREKRFPHLFYPAPTAPAPSLLRTTRKRPILPESEDVKESNAKLQRLIDEVGNHIDQDEGTQPIKDTIKDSVVNSIANSNPLLATVASVIGMRSTRIRDEIK